MISKKYTRDYQIEPYLDRRGKLKDRAVYCGISYHFLAEYAEVRRSALKLLLLTAVLTLTLFPPLLMKNDYVDALYNALPLVVTLLPLCMLWRGIIRVYSAKGENVTREHHDKIVEWIPAGAVILTVICAISIVCTVIYLILRWDYAAMREWISIACAVVRMVLAMLILPLRKAFPMEPVPEKPRIDPKN